MDQHPTPYPEINTLLNDLLSRLHQILGNNLTGLYLYGSLVSGDFDLHISDIDLLAVTSSHLTRPDLDHLKAMHYNLANRYAEWDDRIEVAYLSEDALKTYRSSPSTIAIISPGEPFHTKVAGKDWLINWYLVRERGVTLYGPSPDTLIDPLSKEEFLQAVVDQTREWADWIPNIQSRPYQAYSILTMCRALYAHTHGEQVSKKQAALWAQKELPEWAPLIKNALAWRETYRDPNVDHESTLPESIRFVRFVIDRVVGTGGRISPER